MTQPMPDYAAARRAMIDGQLRPQGVTDRAVLAAMGSIPREQFVPEMARAFAYSDRPVDLGDGKALMSPAALARLLTELQPRPGERALVVGSGNGYSAKVLESLGLQVEVGDISGPAGYGLYDLILIDGAVETVPADLASRLKPDGRLGTALAENGVTRLAIGKTAGESLGLRCFADGQVPVLADSAGSRTFTF